MRRCLVVALALLLLLPTGAAGRPGPVRAGAAGLPGWAAARGAGVIRDAAGVARIHARTAHDLYFLQGWVHAQDRLFQMDVRRRQGGGTLAELLGPGALPSDVQLRTIGLHRAAARSLPALSARARAGLAAYAEGVNAWVAGHQLPPEYAALHLTRFRPWTSLDSVTVAKLIAFGLSFDLDLDLTVALASYQAAGRAAGFDGGKLFFEDLWRTQPFTPFTTVPAADRPAQQRGRTGAAGVAAAGGRGSNAGRLEAAAALARRYLNRTASASLLGRALTPDAATAASNQWAVSGRHAAGRAPLLANDPHLDLTAPSTFYPVGLRAGPTDVIGSGFAGAPGVVVGHNRFISWGATVNPLDVTDTYLEQVRSEPSSPSGLATMYQGRPEPVVPIPEVFRQNNPGSGRPDDVTVVPAGGQVPAATLIVPRRNHGPIIQLDRAAGTALSVQYTGFSPTTEVDAVLAWDDARNLADFRRGLEHFDVGSQNFMYADVHGTIAYFTSSELPLREDLQAGAVDGLPPFFVRDGTGGNEWLPASRRQPGQAIPYEILPPEEMPHTVDPRAGFVVNANNDPVGTTLDNDPLNQLRPGGGIYYLNPGYDGLRGGRIDRLIRQQLARGGQLSARDMQRIQADTVLVDAQFFVPQIVRALARARTSATPALAALARDPALVGAVERLAGWDGSTPTGIPEGYDASDVQGRLPPGEPVTSSTLHAGALQPASPAPGRPCRPGPCAPPPAARQPPQTGLRDRRSSAGEVHSSVAATIYAVWRGQFVRDTIDARLQPFGLPRPDGQRALTALKHLFETFPARGGVGASGVDFFPLPGVASAADRRDVAVLASLHRALDRLAGPEFAAAFHGSTEQGDYRWGLLHRLVLDHPLGGPFDIPPAAGAFPPPLPGLRGIPVDGGFGTVDAAAHDVRASGPDGFMFGGGPANRFVGRHSRHGVDAVSSLPGGTSGVPGSRFYVNLLPGWLANDTFPLDLR
jgi:penicillin amidase